jgi:2-iminobutanoate/2-iminopropanoate deaminase
LVADGIEAETRQVMENIRAILESGGLTMANIVKSSIFLKDMGNFPAVNAIYGTYFSQDPPARETVQVAKLPKDVNIEISVIAFIG